MTSEDARNQLADLISEYLASLLSWSETEIQGEAEGIRNLVLSDVSLLMTALDAERENTHCACHESWVLRREVDR